MSPSLKAITLLSLLESETLKHALNHSVMVSNWVSFAKNKMLMTTPSKACCQVFHYYFMRMSYSY